MIRNANQFVLSGRPEELALLIGAYVVPPSGVSGGIWWRDGGLPRVKEIRGARLVIEGDRLPHGYGLEYFADAIFCDTLDEVETVLSIRSEHEDDLADLRAELAAREQKIIAEHRLRMAHLLHKATILWKAHMQYVPDHVRDRIELTAPLPGDVVVLRPGFYEGEPLYAGDEAEQYGRLTGLVTDGALLTVRKTTAAPWLNADNSDHWDDNVTLEFDGVAGEWTSTLFGPVPHLRNHKR